MENYVFLRTSGKSTVWLQISTITTSTQWPLCQMRHNTWQWSLSSASSIYHRRINVSWWRTNSWWKWLHSILAAEPLPAQDLHKFSADLWLHSQISRVSTWTHSSKLTNVLNSLAILGLQPTMLRIFFVTFGQSSSAFAKQDWNW